MMGNSRSGGIFIYFFTSGKMERLEIHYDGIRRFLRDSVKFRRKSEWAVFRFPQTDVERGNIDFSLYPPQSAGN